jgi:hypothetical protein
LNKNPERFLFPDVSSGRVHNLIEAVGYWYVVVTSDIEAR